MQMIDDLQKLLEILPPEIQQVAQQHPQHNNLIEIVLDLGRRPEARFLDKAEYLSETAVTREHLNYCIQRVREFGGDNRAGIEQTLHRISAIRNRTGDIIGLTCRVGRAVYGTIHTIRDLVESGQSILMLGRPGVGKTTALREIARVLADDLSKRVVIIDTSNEIAGDGDVPHPAIGRARRMQVSRPELQHQVMIEAVENHMPEVIVIDEIGTELEAMAARTIAERGVQLVGTAHGNEIENLIKNPTLSDLVGGIQSVTLGDEEARRRRTQKTVLERKAPPTFDIAVEMSERQRWTVHTSVADTVDTLLRGHQLNPEVRTVNENGQVTITRELTSTATSSDSPQQSHGKQRTLKILPFSQTQSQDKLGQSGLRSSSIEGSRTLNNENLAFPTPYTGEQPYASTPQAGDRKLCYIYPYGISYHQLETVIQELNLPVMLTKNINSADVVLALRSHARKHSNLRRMAEDHQLRIYTIKANSFTQIARILHQVLGLEEPSTDEEPESHQFIQKGSEDEIDALEETRLAVEEIVIPKRQPVELLPRSAKVRAMQHELVERYNLKSQSFGEEPFRRLRIYPAEIGDRG